MREQNLNFMMTQFDDLCQEAEAKDQTEQDNRDICEVELVFEHEVDDNDNNEDLAAVVLANHQCSWCVWFQRSYPQNQIQVSSTSRL